MPLSLSEKKLYLLDFCELVKLGNAKVFKGENPGKHDVMPIMSNIAEHVSNGFDADPCQICPGKHVKAQPINHSSIGPVQPDSDCPSTFDRRSSEDGR